VISVLFVGVVALGYVSWRRNWSGVKEDGLISYENGQALGWSVTSSACLDTAFVRHRPRGVLELGGKLNEQLFLEGCLAASTPTPKLCDNIPPKHDSFVRFAEWTVKECRRHQLWDRDCPLLLDVLATHCSHVPGRKAL
jgi:hypothetical protein